jgi:hypothetical protein
MDTNTDAILNLQNAMRETTIAGMENISIERYGNSMLEKYPSDIIFITSTKTHLTMIYPICSAFRPSNMSDCMNMILDLTCLRKKLEEELLYGTNQIPEENGTEITLENKDLGDGKQVNTNVNCAQKNMNQVKEAKQDFVRITVNLNGDETIILTMSLEIACDVMNRSWRTDLRKQNSVRELALRGIKSNQIVYNLSVRDCPEFFADGLLVHNSVDALRYAIATHHVSVYDPYKHKDINPGRMVNTFDNGREIRQPPRSF